MIRKQIKTMNGELTRTREPADGAELTAGRNELARLIAEAVEDRRRYGVDD